MALKQLTTTTEQFLDWMRLIHPIGNITQNGNVVVVSEPQEFSDHIVEIWDMPAYIFHDQKRDELLVIPEYELDSIQRISLT